MSITKHVVLEKDDIATVESVRKHLGLSEVNGFSAALRIIIKAFADNPVTRMTISPGPDPYLVAAQAAPGTMKRHIIEGLFADDND